MVEVPFSAKWLSDTEIHSRSGGLCSGILLGCKVYIDLIQEPKVSPSTAVDFLPTEVRGLLLSASRTKYICQPNTDRENWQ